MLTNVSFFLNTLFMVLMVVGSAVSLPNNTALGCLHCDQTCPTPDSAWAGPALLHVHLPSDKTSVRNWTPLPLTSLPSDKTSVRNWAPLPLQVCYLTKPQSEIDTNIIPTPSLPSDKTSVRNWTPLSDQLQACHLTKPQSEVGHHCHFLHLILKHNIHTY